MAAALTEEELRAFCRPLLAAFKVPQTFILKTREELPLTATGKVQKNRLRDALAAELEKAPGDAR